MARIEKGQQNVSYVFAYLSDSGVEGRDCTLWIFAKLLPQSKYDIQC